MSPIFRLFLFAVVVVVLVIWSANMLVSVIQHHVESITRTIEAAS
jgi:hypothetical protein